MESPAKTIKKSLAHLSACRNKNKKPYHFDSFHLSASVGSKSVSEGIAPRLARARPFSIAPSYQVEPHSAIRITTPSRCQKCQQDPYASHATVVEACSLEDLLCVRSRAELGTSADITVAFMEDGTTRIGLYCIRESQWRILCTDARLMMSLLISVSLVTS